MITISTAGDSESSPLGLMRAQAHRLRDVVRERRYVRARTDDGSYAMHEWALERDDDVDDLELVKLVNPPAGRRSSAAQRHDSPSMLPWQWARFACGLWMASESWWITGEQWHATRVERAHPPGRSHHDRLRRLALGRRDGARRLSAHDGLVQPLAVWEAARGQRARVARAHGQVDAAIARTFEHYDVVRGYFDPPLWQTELEAGRASTGSPRSRRGRRHVAHDRRRRALPHRPRLGSSRTPTTSCSRARDERPHARSARRLLADEGPRQREDRRSCRERARLRGALRRDRSGRARAQARG
jgi:hypothetical protein